MDAEPPESDSTVRIPDNRAGPVLRAGERFFGRFILEQEIGRGGMGVVWRARDEILGETVALKFLPAMVAADPVSVDELKEETRQARRLRHPNIVSVYDFFQDATGATIAMEFVDGSTLAQLRLEQPGKVFSPAAIAPMIAQICSALDYAHATAKIAHRDLKPANVLVTASGLAKITDFGIARSLSGAQTRLTSRMPSGNSGTLLYISPQQLSGSEPSASDDIYALGATLYELFAGRPPFYLGDLDHQIRYQPVDSVNKRRAALASSSAPIPQAWDDTIVACLAKNPADRPGSAGEIAARLSPLSPSSPRSPTAPPRPRATGLWFALAITAAVFVAIIWGAWQVLHRFIPRPTAARSTASVSRVEPKPPSSPAGTLAPPSPVAVVNSSGPTSHQTAPAEKKTNESQPATSASPEIIVNSLGMKMVAVDAPRRISATLVRRKDFAAFVAAAAPALGKKLITVGADGWQEISGTWQTPGFVQSNDEPVVGVSWDEAQAFCRWLTQAEIAAKRIGSGQRYRLPTEAEWVALAKEKGGLYPWGNQWPPPANAGNFAGQEVTGGPGPWPDDWSSIEGFNDHFARTSPVGSFGKAPDRFVDVGGNVLQWCEDLYASDSPNRVLRGSSWADYQSSHLRIDARQGNPPDFRAATVGFRIVLDSDSSAKGN